MCVCEFNVCGLSVFMQHQYWMFFTHCWTGGHQSVVSQAIDRLITLPAVLSLCRVLMSCVIIIIVCCRDIGVLLVCYCAIGLLLVLLMCY